MIPSLDLIFDIWIFFFGAVLGSFANVCIHRIPRGESIVFPPSRCPKCQSRIAFYDNIPILSWLLLRGRCRGCHAPISSRYPLIELSGALVFLFARLLFGFNLEAVSAAFLGMACIILVATDLEHRILPDEITISVLILGLLLALLRDYLGHIPGTGFRLFESFFLEAVAGALCGALILFLVRVVYQYLRHAEGMGLGDVTMIAMIGAFLGPAGVFLTLLFGSFAGSVFGGILTLVRRIRWRFERGKEGKGLLIDANGMVTETDATWRTVPGAAMPGEPVLKSGQTARPVLVFYRLARLRARKGLETEHGRIMLDDGAEFFPVLAIWAERVKDGLRLHFFRVDIPFGVFLAAGALAATVTGRRALLWLFLDILPPWSRLLP